MVAVVEVTEKSEMHRGLMELQMKSNVYDPVEWGRESLELASQAVYTETMLE